MTDFSYNNKSDQLLLSIIVYIKHYRLEQNKTQKYVAQVANVSRSTLSLLKRGETVTLTTLLRILRVLDLLYILESFKVNTQISPIELAKLE